MNLQTFDVSQAVAIDDRTSIINNLWLNNGQAALSSANDLDAYFAYYTDECTSALEVDGYATIRTHEDVAKIASKLEGGHTKSEIIESLVKACSSNRPGDELKRMAEGSVKLVVRLITMVDIGPILPNCIQGYAPLNWSNDKQDLKTLLRNHFTPKMTVPESSKFGRLFNALNIERYAGLQIKWTDNLSNHLRLVDDDTAFCVFHHVSFLRGQNSSVFPEDFLEETLHTLELLFPRNDAVVQKWLKPKANSVLYTPQIDRGILELHRLAPHHRRIEGFTFWRDELIELKERFDQPNLTSISQLWYDRRNRAQWVTFWFGLVIAVATLLGTGLSFFQTGLGAVQVYKAFRPS